MNFPMALYSSQVGCGICGGKTGGEKGNDDPEKDQQQISPLNSPMDVYDKDQKEEKEPGRNCL